MRTLVPTLLTVAAMNLPAPKCCVSSPAGFDAARCAVGIDLTVSGCSTRQITRSARSAFARARALVTTLAHDPARARVRRRAARRLGKVQVAARHLAQRDTCGDALGLMASHARDALDEAADGTPVEE